MVYDLPLNLDSELCVVSMNKEKSLSYNKKCTILLNICQEI